MTISVSLKNAQDLLSLVDKIETTEVREAFYLALLAVPRKADLSVLPEAHGYMSSLAVHRGDDWCFAFVPAKKWILAYVRKPELRRGQIGFEQVKRVLPHAQQRADSEVNVRLHSPMEMQKFLSLM